jgi:hypothetical protein
MQINYWRYWNKFLWKKNITISATVAKNKTHKMLMAAFYAENDKKPFKNLRVYHVVEPSGMKSVLLFRRPKCSQCKKKINEEEITNFYPSHPEPGKLLCNKCKEIERQVNKLKE